MLLHRALSPSRIARTLVTVIGLSLIQTVLPTIVLPEIVVPKAGAVTATIAPSTYTSGTTIMIPTGVFSVTIEAVGGAGGKGGDDVNTGKNGTLAGRTIITLAVTPGDVVGMYPGNPGTAGANCATGNGGGAGGASTTPISALTINGTYFTYMNFSGGRGGNAGGGGCSGAGGGAGAASVATINSEVVAIAGGAGGGGGTGSGGNNASDWGGTLIPNGTNFSGETGTSTVTCTGSYLNSDGGGGGGGGGGYYGGKGGLAPMVSQECAGISGSPGGNYVVSRATSVTNDLVAQATEGYVKYTYEALATTTCSTESTVVDIYTVEKITYTGNCTWTVPSTVNVIDYFMVGGGAGGAGDSGGGGGGGASVLRTAVAVTPNSTLALKVGSGGGGSTWGSVSNAYIGGTTTITINGTTVTASGGATSSNSPGMGGGVGGTATNGGFAGGQGGTGGTCFNAGSAGKTGSSNYFYGSKLEYGGGGGGGSCPNGVAQTPPAGASGGGNGGYASSSTVNQPGANGTNGTGGGGGGGTATGTGLKLAGGKGGSGVILIRYTTSSADAFPATLASSLSARWIADGLQVLDTSRKGWIDSSGKNASRANSNFVGNPTLKLQGTTDGVNSTFSTKTLLTAAGGSLEGVSLTELPANYTLFHVARYVTDGRLRRIIQTSEGNWLSGHYYGRTGATHHNSWLTSSTNDIGQTYGWLLSTDQPYNYRANGKDVSLRRDSIGTQTLSNGFGINIANATWNEYSDWQVNEVMVFNRTLSASEIRAVENHLARIYGLTLSTDSLSYETDTAASFNGGQYFYTNYGYDNFLNDTFTVEAWINPAQTCVSQGGARCGIFAREEALVTSIYQGNFEYALWGVNSTWEYISTGVKFKAGEWNHIALVKDQPACVNGSLKLYVNGQLAYTNPNSPYRGASLACGGSTDVVKQTDTWTFIGARAWDYERYYGQIDEVKVWKVARTTSQIASDMHSSDTTNASLQSYFDFNRSAGVSATPVSNLAISGPSRSDMIPLGTMSYTEIMSTTVSGPYTTLQFPRTYINQFGGWRVPTGIETATTIVVGGGGGGGFGESTNRPAGAGGGGGVTVSLTQSFTAGATVAVKVGAGGLGGFDTSAADVRNGQSSSIGVGGTLTALGGGGGGNRFGSGAGGSSVATGGGSGESTYMCAGSIPNAQYSSGTFAPGATVPSAYNGSGGVWGWGGSGGGARGAATDGTCNVSQAGIPGPGYVDPITSIEYGRGGNATAYSITSAIAGYTTQNNGWGGIISYSGGNANGNGYRGSTGAVIIRYITAKKPSFTKPVNAYLNVGMTETFTTNVAVDSATVGLTRTFRWESTTAGSGGTFTTIKQGTGASNAAFSWVPSDTSTSGNQYLYRVVVTDSDTVGLFIQDTSPAVFAVINKTLTMTGASNIKKQINVARNETFTIADGTPGYRYTLLPVIPGITLDTSTVGSAVLRISDTASVGTYLETLTVTDSVSASVVIPLSITISAPPNLTNGGEIIQTGQVFHFDPGNSASYNISTGAYSDISGTKKAILAPNGATYSNDFSGVLSLASGSSQYLSATAFTQYNLWTIETWIRLDVNNTAHFCPLTSEYNPTNISFTLCVDVGRTMYTGFHNGSWTYKRSNEQLPVGVWTHLVGTFDGSAVNFYINGVPITVKDSNTAAGLTPPQPSTNRVFINKDYGTALGTPASATYGSIRMYNVGFTQSDVLRNYNATKDRFATVNQNQLKPSQKYGTLNIESFTVTSGGDTKTVSFAVGNRTGILWDTATAGVVRLSVQESLTPGTYFDTITVTDNFAQSTSLPIRFTVSKADTITVIAGAATTQVYNTLPATALPNFTISGLVSSDTGTVVRRYAGVDWTKPCSLGGGCEVGDTGPGGGTIFYISPTVINAATGISSGGTYLEVAPRNWSGLSVESTTAWAKATTSVTGTLSTIGSGAENTRLINNALTTNSVAAKIAADLTLNGKSDWFLPSTLEVKEMYEALYATGLAGDLGLNNYWSSTQSTSTLQADTYWFGSGGLISPTAKTNNYVLRPIRAYSPDTATTTTTPTNADSYTVTVDTITMTTGSLSFYENVVFQRSGLDLTKARQAPLNVQLYGATYGLPFTITLLGGSGTGAMSESLTAGSTATGCAISAHVLTSTSAGTCNLVIKKAASRNYLMETASAVIYLLNWIVNQPTNATGGGSTIGLNGATSVTLNPNAAPTITELSTYTAQAGVTQLVIRGAGFNRLDIANISVKFWRNKVASGFTINGLDTEITVTVPAGTTTGKVTVTTPNGIAVSELPLTITP